MFDRRVKLVLILLALPALAVVARLVQLQVFGATHYRQATEEMLRLPPKQFPCLRGRILDSRGRILACDAPAWDIAVQYGAMVNDPDARKRMCRRLGVPWRELTQEKLDESWLKIAQLTATPVTQLQTQAERIVSRVQRIKRHVSEQRGVEIVIQEEMQAHPVVSGLDQSQQVAARVGLAEFPWVEVASGHRRVHQGGAAVAQIVGQMGRVTDEALAGDPFADDRLARYQLEDSFGVRGMEAVAENWLRGRRGQVHEDRLNQELSPPVEARNGRDVNLTLDLSMQQAMYAIWTRGTSGSAVILDIPTRHVLAMVSYPTIDLNDSAEVSRIQPDDPRRPFLFRAVRGNYNPGSIIKPLILAAGLAEGKVTRHSTVNCIGRMFADSPGWGCEGIHGNISAVAALQHSCNVYFYHLGQQLRVEREAYWMSLFGMGQVSGTNLREEFRGRLPVTRDKGQARQAAIGQSETEITPIQAANLIATVADGVYKPVTLWANNPSPRPPGKPLPVSDADWRTVREGLYDVVNVDGGTAYKHVGGTKFGPYVLLGKTGSAQAWAPEWIYTFRYPDGRRDEERAPNQRILLQRHPGITVERQRKPPEYEQTHSWFVGYLAPRGRHLEPVQAGPASIAIAVIVEYAGHGGEVAVPRAVEMLVAFLVKQGILEASEAIPTEGQI